MIFWVTEMLSRIKHFGRPDGLPKTSRDLSEVDKTLHEAERQSLELEARLRRLEIQATPRGKLSD